MAANKRELAKIMTIGDTDQGKSQLIDRVVKQSFTTAYKATIGADFQSKEYQAACGAQGTLQIWDTAGQERFRGLGNAFFRDTNLAMLCISANAIATEADQTKLGEEVEEFRTQTGDSDLKIPIILVITKCDEKLNENISAQQVEKAAQKFVNDHHLQTVIYTSAQADYFGDSPIVPEGEKTAAQTISSSFGNWLLSAYITYKLPEQEKSKEHSTTFVDEPSAKKSSNAFVRFVSRNRWEVASGLGLMLGLGLFFALFLFIPPAGFVVTAAMLGLMNVGLGLAPSFYMATIGVPVLAAIGGFVAGFFGTKAVRHYACSPKMNTELEPWVPEKSSSLSKLSSRDDEAEEKENCFVGCYTKLHSCCGPQSKGYERIDEEDRSFLARMICP